MSIWPGKHFWSTFLQALTSAREECTKYIWTVVMCFWLSDDCYITAKYVSDWPIIMIRPGGLLSVVCYLFAVPQLVLWVGLEKSKITTLGCEKYFLQAHILHWSRSQWGLRSSSLTYTTLVQQRNFFVNKFGKPLTELLSCRTIMTWAHWAPSRVLQCWVGNKCLLQKQMQWSVWS